MPSVTRPLPGGLRAVPSAGWFALAQAGGLLAVRVRDPHEAGSWGGCPVLALTGRPCPFCGGLRAVSDLTRGDLGAAWSSNAFGVAVVLTCLLLTGAALLDEGLARRRGHAPFAVRVPERAVVALVALVLVGWVAFGLVRLDARWSWLQP